MMDILSLDELLNEKGKSNTQDFIINELLIAQSSILLCARQKVGKTTMIINLIRSIIKNEPWLDIPKDSYHVDSILYLSNDNTPQSLKLKFERCNVDTGGEISINFLFEKNIKIKDLESILAKLYPSKNERVLMIVDVLGGIRADGYDLNNYTYMTDLIDGLELCLGKYSDMYGVILLHHLNKADRILGSSAIGGRVSAQLMMEVDEIARQYGTLNIIGNDIEQRKLYIKHDKNHRWVIDRQKNHVSDKDVEYQLLRINEALSKMPNKIIKGDVNHVISTCHLTITPKNLTRFLKKNRKTFNDNNIVYEISKSNTTIVKLSLKE